jgi:uncharacterized protein with von Willebrand factor type A (vWA) domain
MCTYSVKIDDNILERARVHFKGAEAMQQWIEQQLQKALIDYTCQFEENLNIERKNKEFQRRLRELENDPDGFFKLAGILGKPSQSFSWEQLRDEAIHDKYGI